MNISVVTTSPREVLGPLNDVEQKNAPKLLFLSGDASLLRHGPRVSVVGSRRASIEGLKRASFLARALTAHDIIVVSGLARGVDTAAHTAAMNAGGRTIAVLGTPLDQVFPQTNRALQERIARDHLLVSQFASDSLIHQKNFPLRNRTMALITDATIIVEADEHSGTRHQGWEALRLGRLLFLLESVANDPALTWPGEMIRYGAHVLSRNNMDESLSEIPAMTVRSDESLADFL